jgi:hypothetical protein
MKQDQQNNIEHPAKQKGTGRRPDDDVPSRCDQTIALSWDPHSIGGSGIYPYGPMRDRARASFEWLHNLPDSRAEEQKEIDSTAHPLEGSSRPESTSVKTPPAPK